MKADWQQRHQTVVDSGGLHIIGTERHESRRIDNQLRGRSGRQGDPGSSRFYLSLEDNLMRIFASERVSGLMQKLGMKEGEAIEHPWVNKAIENAQRKVEGRNFDIRKQLLEYDDVANDQRKVVYQQRNELMDVDDIADTIASMREEVINGIIDLYIPQGSIEEQWDVPGLEEALAGEFDMQLPIAQWLEEDDSLHEETLREKILDTLVANYEAKEKKVGSEQMRQFEKAIMLETLDNHWKEHLAAIALLTMTMAVDAIAADVIRSRGCTPSFLGYHGFPAHIRTSPNSVIVHGIPGDYVLEEGDIQTLTPLTDDGHPALVNSLGEGWRVTGEQLAREIAKALPATADAS